MKRNTSFIHLFRNGISILCGILLLSVSISSCSDETWVEPSGSEQGVKMYIRIPAPTIGQTRADEAQDDKYVDPSSVYVFVLSGASDEANDHVLQVVNAVASTGDLFYAKLSESKEAKHVYIVANATDIIKNTDFTGMNLGELKAQLIKTAAMVGNVISGSINPQPMFGERALPSGGINLETTIGTSADPVLLVRTTSKITITNNTTNGNFKLLGANLVNAPKLGYIVSGRAATGNRYPTGADGDIKKMISTPSAGKETETVLYCFESAKKDGVGTSTFVIIEANYLGDTYYYRLNLNNNELDYPLLRNNHYMVNIKNVDKVGYKTVEDAMKNSAANIDYVVNVVDETGRNMVSNGEYYLAVSQTEYYYFTDFNGEKGAFKSQEVATVTHNAPASVLSGACQVSPGITIENGGGFAENTGKLQSFPLIVTMEDGTKEGTITLKLGNLERVIKVYHIKVSDSFHFGAVFNDFAKKGGYIAGKVDKNYESWIRLTNIEQNSDEDNQHSSIEQPDGKIFVRVKANLGSTTSPEYRTGELDLFREDSEGNARIVFKQKMYDIYKDIVDQAKIAPYTYVGTFHRWNETGERLIRIHAGNIIEGAEGNNFQWKVFIVTGDFIRLSDKQSEDPGIHFYKPYGDGDNPEWSTSEQVEKNGQLKNPQTELEVTGPISFRVGLTSKLASPSSQPRYGLIAVIANWKSSNPITRYIYVRQGEEPDYLMRKEDPMVYPADATSDIRPHVEKLSPYNLEDPDHNMLSEPKIHKTDFVKFPSQAGYMYEAVHYIEGNLLKPGLLEKGRGWHEDNDTDEYTKDTYSGIWKDEFEICPSGYHHPKGNIKNEVSGTGNVLTSPIRQSLWLYPKNETASETQNFIIGYLADGYYDRREMRRYKYTESGHIINSKQATTVGQGATNAYIGSLAFNPYNSASLFFPFSGTRQGKSRSSSGENGSFWTSTKQNSDTFWSVAFGQLEKPRVPGADLDHTGTKFRADNFNTDSNRALSVRCVKD